MSFQRRIIFILTLLALVLVIGVGFANAKEGVTIRVSFIDEPRERWYWERLGEFEKLTGTKVVIDFYGFETLYQKNLANCYGHTGEYDVMQLHYPDMGLFDSRGWCYDFTDWVERDKAEFQPEDIHPYQRESHCLFNGRWYGVPMHCNANAFFIRTDIFDKIGMPMPTTWEEVLKASEIIKQQFPDVTPITFEGRRDIQIAIKSIGIMWGFGSYIYDTQTFKPLMDTDAAKNMFDLWQKLAPYAPEGVAGYGANENFQYFSQGKAAMTLSWTHAGSNFYDDPNNSVVQGKWKGGYFPGGGTALGGWSMQINNDSKYKEESWQFLKWLVSPENEMKLVSNMESPRLSVIANPEIQAKEDHQRIYYEILQAKPVMLPKIEPTYELMDYLSAAANSVVSGLATPEEVRVKLQDQYMKIMTSYGLYKEQ